jgi:hypothetical protein
MNVPVILVALAVVVVVFLVLRARKQRDNLPPQTTQATPTTKATPVKSAKRFSAFTAVSPFNKKNPFALPTHPLNQVTVRDPTTGMKATGLSRGGALAKLQGMTGRKINNPLFRRK